MEQLTTRLTQIFDHTIIRFVLSGNRAQPAEKISAVKRNDCFDVETLTAGKAFHEHLTPPAVLPFCLRAMTQRHFLQLTAWSAEAEYALRLTQKGTVLFRKCATAQPPVLRQTHNRQKSYLLEEGASIPPLVDMGIFTKEGKVVNGMYDKFRQINKFLELIDNAVEKLPAQRLHIIDFGCGKSYLTFVVYYYFTYIKKRPVRMTGLDLKADVIERCSRAAQRYGYHDLRFEVGDINGYQAQLPVDMVITLHACDTATDYALYNAVRWNAGCILCVPCCQHELNEQLASDELAIFQRYGIVKERTAALMTDAIRANLLECCGYKTQLLEFIDLSHTPKNLLLRAVRSEIPRSHRQKLLDEVQRLTACFQLTPTFLTLLRASGLLPPRETS